MVILMFAVVIIQLLLTIACTKYSYKLGKVKHKKKILAVVTFVLCMSVFCVGLLIYPNLNQKSVIGNSEKLASSAGMTIYYDNKNDEYFTTDVNSFNVIHLIKRKQLDKNTAKQIVEKVNEFETAEKELNNLIEKGK